MKRTIRIPFMASMLFCAPLIAQTESPRYEVGIRGGVGSYSYWDDSGNSRAVLGVEACLLCSGRFGLFGAFSHFFPPGATSGYQSADLGEVGLRIQGRGRVSPFFDIGFAAGTSRFRRGSYTRNMNTAGGGFGAGVAFRFAERGYIRPQFHVRAMSEAYMSGTVEVAVGYRF